MNIATFLSLGDIALFTDSARREIIWKACTETFQMVSISLIVAILIGLPLGILLIMTRPGLNWEYPVIYQALNGVI